ncbi:hypothetical protein ACHQM5_023512 [Ranunculus cassubicifolius]
MKDLEAGPEPYSVEMTNAAQPNRKANEESKSLHKPEPLKALRNRINGDIMTKWITSVTNGLRKNLKELMMDFQELRQKMMSEYREMVGGRYFTVTRESPNVDVIEKCVASGEEGGENYLQGPIQEHGRGKVLETVVEIKDRHDIAKETAKSLLELHQVFLDMAVMVEAQGDQMDDIEHHVLHAFHSVEDGRYIPPPTNT